MSETFKIGPEAPERIYRFARVFLFHPEPFSERVIPLPARGNFPNRPASIKQGAAHIGVSHWTIRRRIASGELTAYRMGRQVIRIDLDEVEQLFSTIPAVGSEAG